MFGTHIFSYIIAVVLILITVLILYFKHQYSYWAKRNVVFIPPVIPFGNFKDFVFQRCSTGEQVTKIYNELKKTGAKFAGMYLFSTPVVLLIDPELTKIVMTKDFQYFSSRGSHADEKNDPLAIHLLNLNGNKWKKMRSKLTPTFTSGKMKVMFQTLVACSEELEIVLDEHSKKGIALDVKDTMGRFTTDIIGSCAFGIECNSLKEPDNEFRKYGKMVFDITFIANMKILLNNQFPKLCSFLGFKRFSNELNNFFMNVVNDTVDYRIKNNYKRNDFMQLLIQLMKDNSLDDNDSKDVDGEDFKLTMTEVAAQAFVFFLAGFETSSTTLASFMYEITQHQDVQDKIREEIHQVLEKYDGKLTYEGILEMNYLDQAVDESMRLHAVAPMITRKCVQDYKVPDTDYVIEKGTTIFIPAAGFHLDPEYYPDPMKFDTERFSQEEKNNRHPYTFLPFGAGPRNCIGLRFGKMQVKVGIVALLKNYRFTINSKTQLPLKQDPRCNLYTIQGSIWVDAEKIK